jgi:predicted DNA-binding protein with PD1-like motif
MIQAHTFRLKPGQDLLVEIEAFCQRQAIQAGVVLSAVGSLTQAELRLANRETTTCYQGHFEIVAMTGTVSLHGSHLHLAISDGDGHTLGGHLVAGCTIYTTAEIVLAVFPDQVYRREYEPLSGYDELAIYSHNEE